MIYKWIVYVLPTSSGDRSAEATDSYHLNRDTTERDMKLEICTIQFFFFFFFFLLSIIIDKEVQVAGKRNREKNKETKLKL